MVTSLYTFTAESAGESNLKIGQHLANLQTGLWCPVFFLFTGGFQAHSPITGTVLLDGRMLLTTML